MTSNKLKPPKWTIICTLLGALCAFAAAGFAFSHNGTYAMLLGIVALSLYIAAFTGIAIFKKKQSQT